jgi:hypothetical protein
MVTVIDAEQWPTAGRSARWQDVLCDLYAPSGSPRCGRTPAVGSRWVSSTGCGSPTRPWRPRCCTPGPSAAARPPRHSAVDHVERHLGEPDPRALMVREGPAAGGSLRTAATGVLSARVARRSDADRRDALAQAGRRPGRPRQIFSGGWGRGSGEDIALVEPVYGMTDPAGFSRRFPCCRRVSAPSPSTSGSSMPTVAAAGSDAAIQVADTAETCSRAGWPAGTPWSWGRFCWPRSTSWTPQLQEPVGELLQLDPSASLDQDDVAGPEDVVEQVHGGVLVGEEGTEMTAAAAITKMPYDFSPARMRCVELAGRLFGEALADVGRRVTKPTSKPSGKPPGPPRKPLKPGSSPSELPEASRPKAPAEGGSAQRIPRRSHRDVPGPYGARQRRLDRPETPYL